MSDSLLNNNALAALTQRAAPQVLSAIKKASAKTGVNFAYLMEQAAAESNFNTKIKAKTSSATGLYQFIESTWLNMVKKHGHKYGLEEFANNINSQGKVSNPELREEILELRTDPKMASFLAAEFASDNQKFLKQHVGGEIGSTELYFAHFMGASGASGFLNAYKENPLQTAADLFPKAARANYNVFYDSKTGKARTLAGVYEFFDKKFSQDQTPAQSIRVKEPSAAPSYNTYTSAQIRPVIDDDLGFMMMQTVLSSKSDSDAGSWRAMPLSMKTSLLMNPAELLMLAKTDADHDENQRRFNR